MKHDHRIREKFLGSLQGKPYRSRAYCNDLEPRDAYVRRLVDWFDEMLDSTTQDRTILATTHGGPIKTLIPELLAQDGFSCAPSVVVTRESKVFNCSVTKVVMRKRGDPSWQGIVERYADVSFFPAPAVTGAPGDAELA